MPEIFFNHEYPPHDPNDPVWAAVERAVEFERLRGIAKKMREAIDPVTAKLNEVYGGSVDSHLNPFLREVQSRTLKKHLGDNPPRED